MNYFMGVDIGTTSVKAIAFAGDGQLIRKQSASYEMHHPQPGYSEQDPDEIFAAVVTAMNGVLAALLPAKPVLVSFSAAMHSLIAVDERGTPLSQCIIWADNRAAPIAADLLSTPRGEWLYHTTGVPVHAMSPLCKLLWMKEHDPLLFHHANRFIGIKEFVFLKFFDTYAVDTSVASATGFLNMESRNWDPQVLQMVGISAERLSAVVRVEEVFYYKPLSNASYNLSLSAGTPVIIGSSDGALANLGTGSSANDSVSVTIGTSAAVRILSNRPATGEEMSVFCYHAIGDQYIIGGASNNGAIVLQWLRESLLESSDTFETLFDLAGHVPAGAEGLYFIPHILGERAPVWNSDAKGVFFGLSISHTKAHLVRAAMEGILYNIYSIGKQIMKITPIGDIYAAGGFAQSQLWLQLLADVFNCRVLVSGSQENSALGAVMAGIKALNLPITIRPQIVASYTPDAGQHALYHDHFEKFERLYHILKSEFIPARVPAQISV